MNRRTLLALVVLSCSASPLLAHDRPDAGAVYALTNAPTGNAVVIYARAADGSLTPAGQVATGGNGTGAGLGSQGAVIVSDDRRFVFAVNAGSQTVSSFRVTRQGLTLVDVAPSGGVMPTSLTFSRGLLYVLNAGSPNTISGLRVDARGGLRPLPGSTRPLSAAQTNPAQVGFSRRGDVLVVSERATNRLLAYAIDHRGYASAPVLFPSAGPTPFGFAIGQRDTLLVSEAGAGGGASTYRITDVP